MLVTIDKRQQYAAGRYYQFGATARISDNEGQKRLPCSWKPQVLLEEARHDGEVLLGDPF